MKRQIHAICAGTLLFIVMVVAGYLAGTAAVLLLTFSVAKYLGIPLVILALILAIGWYITKDLD